LVRCCSLLDRVLRYSIRSGIRECLISDKNKQYGILMSKKESIPIARESKTIEEMLLMFCHKQHDTKGVLCDECDKLFQYALSRLEKCPFQGGKTTCAKCPVHCYNPDMRERIRAVMRFSGPRMIFRHPIMALLHMKDGFRKKPIKHG
jgi:hypothetical protein